MTSLIHSIRRRSVVAGLVVVSFAGTSGVFASLDSGSDSAKPDVPRLGYGPGGLPPASSSTAATPPRYSVPCETPYTPWQWLCD